MIAEKKKAFNDYAAKQGLRSTRQRDIILDVFLASHQHLSIEELYLKVRAANPGIGFATVYRTVKLLTEAGVARELTLENGQSRYEHQLANEHHDHLICTQCGDIVEFEDEVIERIQKEIALRHGFKLLSHRMNLFGICPLCIAKKKAADSTAAETDYK